MARLTEKLKSYARKAKDRSPVKTAGKGAPTKTMPYLPSGPRIKRDDDDYVKPNKMRFGVIGGRSNEEGDY